MSLLTIIQAACDRLGLQSPSVVMASTDNTVRILRALATQEGRELAARGTWQRLVREQSFTTSAQSVQTGAIPADFGHFVNNTVWDYTEQEPLIGPVEPHQWQALSASLTAPADYYFRLRGNDFLMLPVPSAGNNIRFEYVSAYWVDTNGDGIGEASAWAADANTALVPEEIVSLGVVWRWLKRNRMAFGDEYAEYNMQVNQALGRDGSKRIINMGAGEDRERLRGDYGTRSTGGNWENLNTTWENLG